MTPRRSLPLVAGALLGLGGCLDMALVTEVAFPRAVPGLASDQPWVPLPVGAWVNDGAVEARAIAGCFAPSCAPQAGVGLFRATGSEAARLARIVGDPESLVRFLRTGRRLPRGVAARPAPAVLVSAERIREGAASGFLLAMSAADGTRPAYGAVLATQSGGALSVVMVVAASGDAARRIARDVVREGG